MERLRQDDPRRLGPYGALGRLDRAGKPSRRRPSPPLVSGGALSAARVWAPGAGPEVRAVDTRNGAQARTFVQGAAGSWRTASAGNRVFLLQGGTVTAMPVF